MDKQLTLQQFQTRIQVKYKGKNCSLQIPNYKQVNGLVDEIILDMKLFEVIIQMNDKRYTVSPECLRECLKLLR